MQRINQVLNRIGVPDPKLAAITQAAASAVELAMERVVANHQNPQQYPLPADAKSIERLMKQCFDKLPPAGRNRVIQKLSGRTSASAQERAKIYGHLSKVDLRSKAGLAEQVKALPKPAELQLSQAEAADFKSRLAKHTTLPARSRRAAATATKLVYQLDSLTCNKKSEIGRDEINIAGTATDDKGNVINAEPFFVGKFKEGQTITLSPPHALFTFDLTGSVFPASFSVNFFIIEKDLFRSEDTSNKVGGLMFALHLLIEVAALALIIYGFPITGLAIGIGAVIMGNLGLFVVPHLADDISLPTADELVVAGPLNVGVVLPRNGLVISGAASEGNVFDGEYTGNFSFVFQ